MKTFFGEKCYADTLAAKSTARPPARFCCRITTGKSVPVEILVGEAGREPGGPPVEKLRCPNLPVNFS